MTTTYAAPFVTSDAAMLKAAIVLRPSTAVDRLTPIKGESGTIAERAIEAHGILVRTLRDHGVEIDLLAPESETATESFVGDLAIMLPQGAVLARPAHVERRAEVTRIAARFAALGVPILGTIEAPGLLDATDVAFAGDRVYVGVARAGGGYAPRSNALGRRQFEEIAQQQGLRVVEVALASDVLRLRGVFSVVADDTIVASPDKVDLVSVGDVNVIAVPRGEDLAAGVLAIGGRRVIANLRYRESLALLRRAKISVDAIDLHEFGKAGYGPAALVLAVKRG